MIFHLFITYWDIASGISREYTDQNAFLLTSDLFDILRHRLEQNNWDLKEIEKTCEGLDDLNEILNPNLFLEKK